MAAKIQLNHIAAVLALLASGSALAHGYISQPESRNYLCKTGGNSQCGGVQWEPQSVEGPSGFPQTGPQDGQIASAGSPRWSELNIQTSDRWTFTANHVTRNWRYYLTKQDWNPNQPLTRASFDLARIAQDAPEQVWFCGPEGMADALTRLLPDGHLHRELFRFR